MILICILNLLKVIIFDVLLKWVPGQILMLLHKIKIIDTKLKVYMIAMLMMNSIKLVQITLVKIDLKYLQDEYSLTDWIIIPNFTLLL